MPRELHAGSAAVAGNRRAVGALYEALIANTALTPATTQNTSPLPPSTIPPAASPMHVMNVGTLSTPQANSLTNITSCHRLII